MKRFGWGNRQCSSLHQSGFTILELLIIMSILGILAAIIIPNVSTFIKTGNLGAAKTEALNVRTATQGYLAENDGWAGDTDAILTYLNRRPKTDYTFNTVNGLINGVAGTIDTATDETAWPGLKFNFGDQTWERN
jgi:prepilin-type N-terminal cleavage/methylation domain-containing protein